MLNQKLLIVDDQGELRKMLRIALGYGKYQLFEAENGVQALAVAKAEKLDVILLDVMMPGEYNGFDVCKILRTKEESRQAFVVMITALGDEVSVAKAKEVGANAYVIKPFRLSRLIEIIERRESVINPVTAYSD
jgi:DNA-binding response OmpR family regulator